jgi:hypothetical protein
MIKEINVIELLNACSMAQQKANTTGITQIIKINEYTIEKEGEKQEKKKG